jgi:predicted Zn finger-like uncharacterized protein
MKIVCDSCGTKYSIADDKVRGKVFKIRCKKCSHIIVVRGGESAPEAAAPAADGGWHVVIDGEQVGPLADADVRTKIERGEVKADTYTWKEGFADWVKLSAVPDFAGLVSGDNVAAAAAAGGGGELFTATPGATGANGAERARRSSSTGPSLFGGGEAGDVFASPAAAPSRGGDLFAASAAPSAEESRWPSSGAPAAGHDGGRVESLTGQRHENSVLFSLSNLQSLAMPNSAPKPVAGTSATPEGSGLIDIRAMAASTLGTAEKSSFNGGGGSASTDDLPAFGSFSPAAPVLLPLPSSSGPPKWLYAAGLVMLLALAGIGFMAWKVLSAKPPVLVETVQAVPAPAPAPAKTAPAPATKPSTIADDKLPPREGAAEAAGKPERSDREHHRGKHEHEASKSDKKGDKGGAASTTAVASAEPSEKKPAKGSLDDLLDGAVRHPGGGGRPRVSDDDGKPAASAGPLAKSAVVAGMNSVKPKIAACYNEYKQQGMAMVNVVIGKNGKVASATVTGKFAGTPTGACVEKAVKSASFPPSDGFSTPYPFQLR